MGSLKTTATGGGMRPGRGGTRKEEDGDWGEGRPQRPQAGVWH
jgi:hypothetical protein